jgi:toxin YoeB
MLLYTRQAEKDAKKAKTAGYKPNIETLLAIIAENPYQTPPRFERLVAELAGAISRRINIQHRLLYQVLEKTRTVKVLRMCTHYE